MSFAPDGKPVVYVPTAAEQIEEFGPELLALSRVQESIRVADHNEGIPRSRQQYVEALWRKHEADVMGTVTPGQTGDDDIALFALVVVW